MSMRAWGLTPEVKHERAQAAQRGTVQRVLDLLAYDVKDDMSADDVEMLGLNLKLAGCNLLGTAGALREVEAERQFLAREMDQKFLRFEPEPMVLEQTLIEGREFA